MRKVDNGKYLFIIFKTAFSIFFLVFCISPWKKKHNFVVCCYILSNMCPYLNIYPYIYHTTVKVKPQQDKESSKEKKFIINIWQTITWWHGYNFCAWNRKDGTCNHEQPWKRVIFVRTYEFFVIVRLLHFQRFLFFIKSIIENKQKC